MRPATLARGPDVRLASLTSIYMSIALVLAIATAHAASGRYEQTVAADPKGTVEISNVSGEVEVEAWDQNQVSVSAHLDNDYQQVDVSTDRGRTSIAVRMPGAHFGGGGDADLKVKVPRGSEVDITAVSADITSTGVMGAQRLKSVSGSIKADIGQADVEAKTVSGDVVLRGQGGKPAQLHLTSISGSIRLEHGSGDLEANTTSGSLSIQLDTARSVRMRTIAGDVTLRGKLTKDADVDAQTVSGPIKMSIDSDSGFEYDVSTFSGDIGNCFNAKSERTSRYGPGERLSGSLGKGSAHVRMKTMSGDINLCDKP
jgi:Putative adhesin